MFGLFKKKSQEDKLRERYEKLMSEAHALSNSNRKASETKMKEADDVMQQLESLSKA